MNDLVITRLDGAKKLLAEARTIQQTKSIVDIAAAAEVYAKRHQLGEEAIGYAHEIKTYALRKLGEMLKATERNKGASGSVFTGSKRVPVKDSTPTLADLGIDKKVSMLAQQIADLPLEKVEAVAKRVQSISNVQREHKRATAIAALKAIKRTKNSEVIIEHTGMEEFLPRQNNLAAIITDPPYGKNSINLYRTLAKLAKNALAPDGILAVMCGQMYLPETLSVMTEFIPYRWTLAYLTPGGQSPQIWPRKVNTFWKPILLFGSSSDWIGDVIRSDVNDNDKRFHEWGQAEAGTTRLIESLTKPGDVVCDPFIGGGTVPLVCVRTGRRFVGCDMSKEAVDIAQGRIGRECQTLEKKEQAGAI